MKIFFILGNIFSFRDLFLISVHLLVYKFKTEWVWCVEWMMWCFLLQPPGGVPAAQPMLPNMDPRLQGERASMREHTHSHTKGSFLNIRKVSDIKKAFKWFYLFFLLFIFRSDAKDERSQRNGTDGPWTPGNTNTSSWSLVLYSYQIQTPSQNPHHSVYCGHFLNHAHSIGPSACAQCRALWVLCMKRQYGLQKHHCSEYGVF